MQSITKINVDSTFSKLTGVCFAGAIARNSEGDVVSGNTSFNRATSCFVAEALALRDAASLANNLGITNVVFESDCLDLIKACRGEIVKNQIQNILNDIWSFKQNFVTCGFTWTPRSGNEVAHTVAHLASLGSLPVNWTWNCPEHLRRLIDKERPRCRPNRQREEDQISGSSIIIVQEHRVENNLLPSSSRDPSCSRRVAPPGP